MGRWKSDKAALHETLHNSSANLKTIADACGKGYSAVQKWGDEFALDHYPSARSLPALIAAADNTAYLEHLNQCAGLVGVKVPSVSGVVCEGKLTADLARSFAAAIEGFTSAKSGPDDPIYIDEAERFGEFADTLVAHVLAMKLYANREARPRLREFKVAR